MVGCPCALEHILRHVGISCYAKAVHFTYKLFYMSKPQPNESLLPKVREILEKVKPENPSVFVNITSHLSKDLGLDSLDIVEFVLLLEWNFKISITDHEAENLSTVAQAIHLIHRKKKEA